MMNTLNAIGKSVWYWLAILGLGAFMEAAALYFQYGLGYGPCVLCIHIRIYVMAIMLVGSTEDSIRTRVAEVLLLLL